MCGTLLGGMLGPLLHFSSTDTIVLAVIGMGTCLGSVVRAPVTGILIVFEMTHEFSLVPGLIVGTLVSLAITRRLSKHSFYEAILVQDGKLAGMLSRDEAVLALTQRRPPKLFPAKTCSSIQTIREIALLLIDAPAHVLVVLDQAEGKVVALLTLHDLLRAEIAYGQA